jgi:hypothetical protein
MLRFNLGIGHTHITAGHFEGKSGDYERDSSGDEKYLKYF